jgi:hypothetical protein
MPKIITPCVPQQHHKCDSTETPSICAWLLCVCLCLCLRLLCGSCTSSNRHVHNCKQRHTHRHTDSWTPQAHFNTPIPPPSPCKEQRDVWKSEWKVYGCKRIAHAAIAWAWACPRMAVQFLRQHVYNHGYVSTRPVACKLFTFAMVGKCSTPRRSQAT